MLGNSAFAMVRWVPGSEWESCVRLDHRTSLLQIPLGHFFLHFFFRLENNCCIILCWPLSLYLFFNGQKDEGWGGDACCPQQRIFHHEDVWFSSSSSEEATGQWGGLRGVLLLVKAGACQGVKIKVRSTRIFLPFRKGSNFSLPSGKEFMHTINGAQRTQIRRLHSGKFTFSPGRKSGSWLARRYWIISSIQAKKLAERQWLGAGKKCFGVGCWAGVWGGDARERGHMCVCRADSHCCIAEINITP